MSQTHIDTSRLTEDWPGYCYAHLSVIRKRGLSQEVVYTERNTLLEGDTLEEALEAYREYVKGLPSVKTASGLVPHVYAYLQDEVPELEASIRPPGLKRGLVIGKEGF